MGQAGVRHKPGYDTPHDPVPAGTYACSDCHGPNLDDGFASSCNSCHHRGTYGGIDHAQFPSGARQEPMTYCALCHGADLTGDLGPSCFTCHGQVWPDPPPPNQPPVADPGGPYAADPGQAVTFDGSASSDLDGTIVSYDWDFGDGTTARGASPTHTYTDPGSHLRYTVRLTVTDNDGATDMATTTAAIGWTSVPTPPVNQNVGMIDVAIVALVEADCRACHESGVPDRHHLLYGTDRGGVTPPYPDPAGGTAWTCLNCHGDTFTIERNCVVCHTASAHHTTPDALARNCVTCHGDLVDNFDDGHFVPTYAPSLVTPRRSGGDGLPANSRGTLAGGCNYCHDDDGMMPPVILTNQELHHNAGLSDCSWCHDFALPTEQQIRICESCHGPDSLHNIQADSPAAGNVGTLVVGGEEAGYGHVGRDGGPGDSDCWGCHGFSMATAPVAGPIIPSIGGSNIKSTRAGTDAPVIVGGSGFTNRAGDLLFEASVLLTAGDGSTVTLTPDTISQDRLTVTIPGTMAPGNYDLQAVKARFASNPAVISIVPEVVITNATVDEGTVTINGGGFGGYAAGSITSVTGRIRNGEDERTTATVEGTVVSWRDTAIVAEFPSGTVDVTVHSVFGTDTSELGGGRNWVFLRGDANADGDVDLSDAVYTLSYLFRGGPAPICPDASDSDDDGLLALTDAVFILHWIFLGGGEFPTPGPEICGPDPTEDALPACDYDPTGC